MKKVLYLTNIEVPYRVRFFNELSRECALTVLCERKSSSNRDKAWTQSVQRNYSVRYLCGIKVGNENCFSLGVLRHILSDYDSIIVGCYNSPVGMTAILLMKLLKKKYFVNLDGEQFITPHGLKSALKRFFLRGADGYLCAGLHSSATLAKEIKGTRIYSYCFGSLTRGELEKNRQKATGCERNGKILVVGQYFDYKGMDVALEAARLDSDHEYIFVGMGVRTELFARECNTPEAKNVTLIPFLDKEELSRYYTECSLLVLPSRQECWGLVVGEAASFGMPIVSTKGSGAALEFLSGSYPQYLAEAGDARSLACCIRAFFDSENKDEYSRYLLEMADQYSIEANAEVHLHAIGS